MATQWRQTPRWAVLGSIAPGAHEAFLVLDPLTAKHDAVALLQHIVPSVLHAPHLWQQPPEPPARSGLFR